MRTSFCIILFLGLVGVLSCLSNDECSGDGCIGALGIDVMIGTNTATVATATVSISDGSMIAVTCGQPVTMATGIFNAELSGCSEGFINVGLESEATPDEFNIDVTTTDGIRYTGTATASYVLINPDGLGCPGTCGLGSSWITITSTTGL